MQTYFMFGKYSKEALKNISSDRTRKAFNMIQEHGGRVKSAYALLGDQDLVFIVNLPDAASATMISIKLANMTGIAFTTSQAISVEDFDKQFNHKK